MDKAQAGRDRLLFWGLLGLTLALRAAYVLIVDVPPLSDAARWNDARLALLHGLPYDVGWPPFYPALMAAVSKIFGEGLTPLYLLNAVLSTLTGALVFLSARETFGRRTAFLALLFFAVYVDLIWYCGLLMAETFGLLLFCATVYAVIRDRHPALVGTLFGLTCMAKGLFILAAPALVFWCYYRYKGGPWLKKTLIAGAFTFLMMLPWNVRNFTVHKDLVPLEPTFGCTVFDGHNPYSTGGCDYLFLGTEYAAFYTDPKLSIVERDRICLKKSVEFALANPWREVQLTALKLSKHLSYTTSFVFYRYEYPGRKVLFGLSFLQNMVIFTLCVLGIAFSYRDKNAAGLAAIIGVMVLYFVTLFAAEVRKRLPFVPFMLIFAAYGAALLPGIIDKIRRGQAGEVRNRLLAAGGVSALLALNSLYRVMTRFSDVVSRFQ